MTELRALERQLRQSQKFEAIGQLAGGVAHDFTNVVGAILGWAEIGLEHSRDNPDMTERFERIREQADRAAALTRELLAFARRQVLQPRAVDLNSVADGLHNLLDKVIDKNIEVKFLTTPLDPVKADPTQLEQVLMNLCINARDAMPEGGRLVIETEMVELDEPYCRFYPYVTPGRYAVLSVSDTGSGMDPETRERIFEPFFTTKERGKGTGMGLATVYGIVKQHGGFIHVYTEPSHGSLFRVYVPAMEGAALARRGGEIDGAVARRDARHRNDSARRRSRIDSRNGAADAREPRLSRAFCRRRRRSAATFGTRASGARDSRCHHAKDGRLGCGRAIGAEIFGRACCFHERILVGVGDGAGRNDRAISAETVQPDDAGSHGARNSRREVTAIVSIILRDAAHWMKTRACPIGQVGVEHDWPAQKRQRFHSQLTLDSSRSGQLTSVRACRRNAFDPDDRCARGKETFDEKQHDCRQRRCY